MSERGSDRERVRTSSSHRGFKKRRTSLLISRLSGHRVRKDGGGGEKEMSRLSSGE